MSDERDKFGVSLEEQLKHWQQKLDESKAKAEKKGPDFLARYNAETEKLAGLYEDMRYRLKLLRMSSGDAWGEMRVGIEKAFGELKKSVTSALEKF
jgi:predicted chitinase